MKKAIKRKLRKKETQLVRVAAAIGSTLGVIAAKVDTASKVLRTRTVRGKRRLKRALKKS